MSLKYTGIGTRVLNFCIDTPLIFLLSYVGNRTHHWYVFYYRIKPINFWLFYAAATFIFYFLFEYFFSKTPGKWFTQTRVCDVKGLKPSIEKIFIRSITRIIIIDPFFIPFFDKPLHDYLSKTDLVED